MIRNFLVAKLIGRDLHDGSGIRKAFSSLKLN